MRFAAIYHNFADRAILTGGSWQDGLPLSNLQTPDPSEIARSRTAQPSDTVIEIDLGRPRPVGGFGLGPINISRGGRVEITAYSGSDKSEILFGPLLLEVGGTTVNSLDLAWEDSDFWYGFAGEDGQEDGEGSLYVGDVFDEDVSASYWRIVIYDQTNADGFLEVGRLVLGRAFRPSINYGQGDNALTIEPLTDAQESLGGTTYYQRRGHRRIWRGGFDMLGEDELFGHVFRMMSKLGVDGQMFIIPNRDDGANFQKRSFLATFGQVPAIVQTFFRHGSTAFELREVL